MIGSAGSLDGLNALVKKMWGWETVIFTPVSDNEWSVSSFKGVVDALRVVKKGRRFRFEQRLPGDDDGHAAGSVAIRRAPISPADFFAVKIANRLVSDYGVPEQRALHLIQRMEPAVRRAYERGQSVDRTTRELLGE
jgi:hypothetical protein